MLHHAKVIRVGGADYNAGMNASIGLISPTQRRVLIILKRLGEATAEELAEALDITASAVRQHLNALRSAGYIAANQQRGLPGRPADVFHTTLLTETMFVRDTNDLSVELLSFMEEENPELVSRVFERRRQRRVAETASKLAGKTLGEKVAVLTAELDAEGFLADFDQIDSTHYRINLHSCAIWIVATRYGQACASELDYLRELLPEATVERVTHKTAGAHVCAYEVSS